MIKAEKCTKVNFRILFKWAHKFLKATHTHCPLSTRVMIPKSDNSREILSSPNHQDQIFDTFFFLKADKSESNFARGSEGRLSPSPSRLQLPPPQGHPAPPFRILSQQGQLGGLLQWRPGVTEKRPRNLRPAGLRDGHWGPEELKGRPAELH